MNLRSRALAIAVVVAGIGAPLHADLRVTSVVEVKDERPRPTGLSGQFAFGLLPFRAVAGKANLTTLAAGGAVRVEGLGPVLGLPAEAVLISTADGRTVCLLPSRREFFTIANPPLGSMGQLFETTARTKRRGTSDVLLGEKMERRFVTISVDLNLPDDGMVYNGAVVIHESQLRESDEQRVARWMRAGALGRISRPADPITIESWYSNAFGADARTVAASPSHVTWLTTAGFAGLVDRSFALREVVVNPVHGYRMETRVTGVQNAVVGSAAFAVPADYIEVAAPPAPRTITLR